MTLKTLRLAFAWQLVLLSQIGWADEAGKQIVFVAGKPSHGYGAHEHNAGCLLLANYVREHLPGYETVVHRNGWPADGVRAFDNADAVVVYCDGGTGHLLLPHLDEFDKVMQRGVGLACLHYGVEVPKDRGGLELTNWIGGYFETHWSVNPHWTAKFASFPEHPITRGVAPFEINDEWYFHMRFRPNMQGVTPVLSAQPPAATMKRQDGPHSGNQHVRAALQRGEIQHLAWACERPDGGRGFGFTGGHSHWNWGDDNFRKLVLNAIVWIAHGDVPQQGVGGPSPERAKLEANQDFPKPVETDSSRATPQRTPETAIANLDVHPELDVSLFAAEPMLLSPSNIDIDHRGRVWVCEVVNYRQHRGKRAAGDRILILEDTDEDGKADKRTVFYQGTDIDSPHGVCVLGNQVIVSAGPHVLCLTDTNGDDRADQKEVWFQGIQGVQHDHGIHAFVFGPDGKLYFNFGNEGKQLLDPQGKPVIDLAGNTVTSDRQPYQQGMVFRCNLDRSQFETLGWNFRNNWMLAVDSFGTIWQSDNDDDGNRGVRINYVMEFGNYGYRDELTGAGWRSSRTGMADEVPLRHWHLNDPGVVPNLLQTGAGSPTGIAVYEGDALPRVFQGQLLHCDAGPSVTRAYIVAEQGAGYRARIVNLLEGVRDQWFRPSDVKVAPDGSLIVADWYDPGVGGHRMGDLDRGRLFRLTAKGQSGSYRIPPLDIQSIEGAIQGLRNPNLATRYLAFQALRERGAAAEPALQKQMSADQPGHLRAHALWLLAQIPSRGQHYVDTAMSDDDSRIRMLAVRVARQLPDVDAIEIAERLSHDAAPNVRRECAIALRHCPQPRAASIWAVLAATYDWQDRWYLEALGIAADQQWDRFLDAYLKRSDVSTESRAYRDLIWRSRGTRTAELLVDILTSPSTPADELSRMLRALDFVQDPQRRTAIKRLALEHDWSEPRRAVLIRSEAFARLNAEDMGASPERQSKLRDTLDGLGLTARFVELVERFGVADRYDQVVQFALTDPDESMAVQAARMVLKRQAGQRFLDRMAAGDEPGNVAIVELLGRAGVNEAVPLLTSVLGDHSSSNAVRSEAVRSLARLRMGADWLVHQAETQQLPTELSQAVAANLHRAAWDDVRERANQLFPLGNSKDQRQLPPISELAQRIGDPRRGRQVFAKSGTCAKCHVVNDEGKQVGPDLSGIGKKLSRDALLESILYPSAGISHNYETYVAELVDGNVISGILVSETAEQIDIKNNEAITQRVGRDDLERLTKQPISLMPADIHTNLTEQELVDLVDYLTTLQ